MVIAQVLSSFHIGGQERVAFDLAVGLRARGYEVLAVSLAPSPDGPLAAEFQAVGIPTFTVPKWGPTVDLTLPVRLAKLFRKENVSVVHTHNPQPLIYAGLAGKLVNARVVQTRHGVAFHSDRQIWLARQAARFVDSYVVVSPELADQLRDLRICHDDKMRIVENGIDLSRFYPSDHDRAAVREELGIPSDALVIGTVSRLVPSKNVAGLLRALLPRLGEKRQVVVVGDGPERGALEIQARLHPQSPHVHFTGPRADVPRLLRAFDLFVLFSRTEGHPLVVLEAMATELPVLATRVGGIPSIVREEVTGFLVAADDEQAVAHAVEHLAAEPLRMRSTGQRARAVALARYASTRMVNEYLALYAPMVTEPVPWPASL